MFSVRATIAHLYAMRKYFAMAAVLFFAGAVVGGTNESLHAFLNSQMAGLAELAGQAESSDNPGLFLFLLIFFNNAIKSVFVMYLGALLGVLPVLFLIVNGMVIGYLYTALAEQGHNAALIFVKGVLPHGIIEIPAILLASAYGMKFGALGFRLLASMFKRQPGLGAEYETFVIRTVPVMLLIITTLLAAAAVESTLTFWLMSL